MNKLKLIGIPIAILIVGWLLMNLLFGLREEEPVREPVLRPKAVKSTVVQKTSLPATINALGRLTSAQPIEVIAEVEGEIQRGNIRFQPGQRFKRGDVIVRIDDRQVRLELNSAKSDFLNALAIVLPEIKIDFPQDYEVWEQYFNSISFDQNLPELPEVNNQKIKLFLSRFNVYKLFFNAKNIEIRLNKHIIKAPFNGSIIATDSREGSIARRGSRLASIINLDDLEVTVPIPSTDVVWIDPSKPVTLISTDLNGEWTGTIIRIGSQVDNQTQTVPVYIKVDQTPDHPLFEGAFLEANIAGKNISEAVGVARSNIYQNQFVYVIKNRQFDYVKVDIVRMERNRVIVQGGLNSGDTLVTELLQGITAGMPAIPILTQANGN